MKQSNLNARSGYGLALIMVFLATTVMIGTSLQIMAAPITIAYLGAASQDNLAAQQLAQTGMNVVVADLQSQYDAGGNITTGGYSYLSSAAPGSVQMPQSPDALGGATSTVGSYKGTISYINGNSMLVNVTATVGSGSYTYSKLVTLSRGIYSVSNIGGATAAYGLRKLNSSYTGSAIRVRRASDNTETDIGFTGTGDLDVDALRQFLGTSLPLDSVSSAGAAFSLRKLRAAYTGSALRVRRSSDNTETDIGFDPSGNLDVSTLMDFVGTGSGYITKWYDQSGNGRNATQTTKSKQPMLVSSGVLNMLNGRPAIKYDWSDDIMDFSRPFSGDFAILGVFNVNQGWDYFGSSDGEWFGHDGLVDMDIPYEQNDFGISVDSLGRIHAGMGSYAKDLNYDVALSLSMTDGKLHWFTMNRQKSSGIYTLYGDNSSIAQQADTNTIDADTTISIGALHNGAGGLTHDGYVNEIIVYSKFLSGSELQTLKNDQAYYWNMLPAILAPGSSYLKPLDVVGSAKAAFGLRQLRGAYAGSAIRIRRSSDNTEKDIGFVLGDLDTASLMSFVGSGSGYVKTWYDQSGSNNHFTQTSNGSQPRIVNAGALEMVNGKPAIRFDNNAHSLTHADLTGINDYSAFAMVKSAVANPNFMIAAADTSPNAQLLRLNGNKLDYYASGAGSDATNSSQYDFMNALNLVGIVRSSSGSGTGTSFMNGEIETMSPYWGGAMGFGRIGGLGNWIQSDGWLTELILYPSALSTTNSTALMQNMLQYYSAPLQTAYVTKWYDQSGNGNDLKQANPAQQPVLSFGADGSVQSRPTLIFNGDQYNTTGAFMDSSSGFPTNSNYSISAVYSYRNGSTYNNVVSSNNGTHAMFMGGTDKLALHHNSAFVMSTVALSANSLYSVCATFVNSSKLGSLYVGPTATPTGTGTASVTNNNADIRIGAFGASSLLNGTISEAIVFNKVLSTNERQYLYRNQTTYYGAR